MDAKKILNEGIDIIGKAALNLLPGDGFVKNALKQGLDNATDAIFDPKVEADVPLSQHSELKELADNLAPLVVGLIKNNVLKPIDLPFVEGENEELFEQGLCLQIEALIRQAVTNMFQKKA